MGSVGVNLKVSATKGSLELDHHNLDMPKEVRHGRGFSEEDESRINEDVNGCRRIELVKYHDAMQRQQQQAQGPVVQWERFLPLRSLKVLLVETDDSTRHVVSALLRNCSYEVTAVANGLEAWKVLVDLNKQIDLVLTEVVMPYLSGVGLLSKIMTHVPRKNIPVIMMSSDDSMGIVFNCLSKGAVDFLVKPIRKNELKNLWQHVWRKCHSSSGSGSESGIRTHKSVKSRSNEGLDDDSNSDEDDDRSIAVAAKDGSDNGSGTQSFSSKRAVEVDSSILKSSRVKSPVTAQVARHKTSNSYLSPTTITGDHDNEDEKQDTVAMGKDLEIGVSKSSGIKMKDSNKKVNEKSSDLNLKKMDSKLGNKKSFELTEGASVMLAAPERSNAHGEAVAEAKDLLNNINIEEKSTYHANESPALELSLKRPRDVEDNENQERNVLRHSGLSAFSRYNTMSNTNQDPTGNVGSCSAKPKNTQSNSNIRNHVSNGSSNENDMGSTTNNAFTKPEALTNDKTIQHKYNPIPTLELLVPSITDGDTVAQPRAVHHHHHYHHHHHHVHKQKMADNDDGSLRNMASNVLTTSAEGNAANYGSASGSNNKSNGENGGGGQKGSSLGAMADGGEMGSGNGGSEKCRDGDGNGSGSRSGVDQERLAQREAALYKFRQKRKDRCFEKKVRYQSRKKLAEERPRVRGQFVRQGTNGIQNKDADS